MDNKMLFMIYNGEIKFLNNSTMDHREWYDSLGGDPNLYDNTIRGMIYKGQLIFYKANLSYDNEVIETASRLAPIMKQQLGRPDLKVCCGINPGQGESGWEPIMVINEQDLKGFNINIQDEVNKQKEKMKQQQAAQNVELQPVLEFKNNYDDPKFIRLATILTSIVLVLSIIAKVLLVTNKKLDLNSGWNVLLVVSQVVLLVLSIIGYNKKIKATKFIGLAASVSLFFMFDLFDLILGVIYIFFTIDQGYILGAFDAGKKGIDTITKK